MNFELPLFLCSWIYEFPQLLGFVDLFANDFIEKDRQLVSNHQAKHTVQFK